MIVLKKVNLKVLFQFSGGLMAYILALAILTWQLSLALHIDNPTHLLPSMAVFGTILSLFLAFRTNEAYNRWWEARQLWGNLLNQSRNFARQVLTLLPGDGSKEIEKRLVYRHIAYVNALRLHLRRQDRWQEASKFMETQEWEAVETHANIPRQIIQLQAESLKDIFNKDPGKDFRWIQMDTTLSEFYNIQGGCERIKNTVFPRLYAFYTTAFSWLFASLLVLSLFDEFDWQTLIIRSIVAYVFITLDKLGQKLKNPFENYLSDTPMSSLCRTIEIELKQQLGEKEVPSPLEPVDGVLY
ncbi:MAG: bestrophin family ion channel [Bacteroidetes bacterium]|nr:bestrophin family ion channel [Bacteroidota bacterium]